MRTSPILVRHWFAALILLMADPLALAQQVDDKPKTQRATQLSFQQGKVVFSPAGSTTWYDSEPERPISLGDRIWVHEGARVELLVAATTLRAAGQVGFHLTRDRDNTVRFMIDQGRVRVKDVSPARPLEVGSDNTSFAVRGAGEYELEAMDDAGVRVIPIAGDLLVYQRGLESLSLPVSVGQQFVAQGPHDVSVEEAPPRADDAFGLWAAERNRIERPSPPISPIWNEVGTTPARTAQPTPIFWARREAEIERRRVEQAQSEAEQVQREARLAKLRREAERNASSSSSTVDELQRQRDERERDREWHARERRRWEERDERKHTPKFDPPRISFPSPPHQFNLPPTPPPAPAPWTHPR